MERVYLCPVMNCALTTSIMSLNNSFLPLYHARTIYDSYLLFIHGEVKKFAIICLFELPIRDRHAAHWFTCFPFTVTYLPLWKCTYMPFLATFWSTALITFSPLLLILVRFQKETFQHVHCHVDQPCFQVTKVEGVHMG